MTPTQLMFLPGALGRTQLWKPVSDLISTQSRKILVGWPGFDSLPPDPTISSINDLVAGIVAQIDHPTALIAQSMGGVVAIRVALQKPDLVTHLVLAVTSGGIDVTSLGGQDWRSAFLQSNPQLPRWFAEDQEDLTQRLAELAMPVLLLWGDADPISPVSVGERLAALLPSACLHVVAGGDHDLVETHATRIAPLIQTHLSTTERK